MDVRRGLRRSVTVLLAIALFGQAGTLAAADDEA